MDKILREGDTDLSFGKVIKFLILQTDNFIVYIDSELDIQWRHVVETNKEFGKVLNRVAYLESRARFITDAESKLLSGHSLI